MTPEQIAADRIARAVEKATGASMERAAPIGRAAVEYIAAAGLVILTAERLTQLLDVQRTALALARSEESMASQLRGEDLAELFDPWPEADALLAALRTSGAMEAMR